MVPQFVERREMPCCAKCGGILKPNVILYGEELPHQEISNARRQAGTCDVMLVAGSSLSIAPVADLPFIARGNGARVIVINQEPTPIDSQASLVIRADVAVVLPRIVSLLIARRGYRTIPGT
jgi:NAD-dependent deacetylase